MTTGIIRNITVVGAGTMGHSIALAFAIGGSRVVLVDRDWEAVLTAERLIETKLTTLIEAGGSLHSNGPDNNDIDRTAVMQRIRYTTDLKEGCSGADFVIEAVFEDPAVKKAVFAEMDAWAPPHAVLASNTSFLDIFEIVGRCRPDRLLIVHWYAPAHIIPLVEVVRGPETDEKIIGPVMDVLRQSGKRPVLMKQFSEGFIVNKFQSAIRGVIEELLDSGMCEPSEIDEAVRASLAIRMPILGVVQKLDFAGLDVIHKIQENHGVQCKSISEKVARGELGIKTGKGFYDYAGLSFEEAVRLRDRYCLEVIKLMDRLDVWEGIL